MNIHKLNQFFRSYAGFIIRYRWIAISLYLILIVLGVLGLKGFKTDSNFDSYFMEGDPMIVKTNEFKQIFGNDSFIAVLVENDNIISPHSIRLIRELSQELEDSVSYADKVVSLTNFDFISNEDGMIQIGQIVPDVIEDTEAFSKEIDNKLLSKPNVTERIVSKDRKSSWVLLRLKPFVTKKGEKISADKLTGQQVDEIVNKAKYKDIHPSATGMPYINYVKPKWFGSEISKIMGIAIIISIIILILVARSFRGVLLPIITSISSNILLFGLLGYTGYKPDPGMMSIPLLMSFAIPLAYNIHVFTYFRKKLYGIGSRREAIIDTFEEMGWPVLFSALTTIAALLTFLFIPVQPLHFVGFGTGLSITFAFLVMAILFPAIMSFGKDKKVVKETNTKGSKADKMMEAFGIWVLSHRKLILFICVPLLIFFFVGAFRVRAAFDVEKTMGNKVPYVNKVLHIAKSPLGSLYSYDVMITFNKENEAKKPSNLHKLDSLSSFASKLKLTKRTTSILQTIKDLNATISGGDLGKDSIPDDENKIAQLLLLYENAGGSETEYWIDYDYKRLRLMVELGAYDSDVAEKELANVQSYASKLFPDANVQVVGSVPQFTTMMQYVVRGQIVSFLLSLCIIALLLVVVFRSFKVGIVGMIPNLAPGIVVAGIMGWMNIPLDMMTATIIPIIIGLSVDDTIHFINHGHLEFDRCKSYRQAVVRTFKVAGISIIFSTVIICSNFAVYIMSDASSVARIGYLSVAGLITALLADLCITPLLFKDFRIFGKEKK